MPKRLLTPTWLCLAVVAGCAKEPPPRPVSEFMENPILLDAAIVRCGRDRSETRYDAECINAREAVKRIAAREEAERRAELEAESERKRQALRRTQEAAAEARRRAAEAERLRREAEYLAQFGELPPESTGGVSAPRGNEPGAEIGERIGAPAAGTATTAPSVTTRPLPEDGGPASEDTAPPAQDLKGIRDELRRRNEGAAEGSTTP